MREADKGGKAGAQLAGAAINSISSSLVLYEHRHRCGDSKLVIVAWFEKEY